MRLAAEKTDADGEIYFIAGDKYITLNQYASLVAQELGVSKPRLHFPVAPVYGLSFLVEKFCVLLRVEPPLYRRRVDFFTQNHAFDISKARSQLGYEPKVSLEEGIHLTAEWYRTHGYLESNRKK